MSFNKLNISRGFFKDFKSLVYAISLIGLGCLSFFGCVSIWDSHLDKVHSMEMELLEKNKLIEIDLLEKKKAIEIDLLERKNEVIEVKELSEEDVQRISDAAFYFFWGIVGAITFTAVVYLCSGSDSVGEQLIKSMDASNFSKIEVMQKQVEVMFPKVLEIEDKVFDLHCHMDYFKGDGSTFKGVSDRAAGATHPRRSIAEDIFKISDATFEKVMEKNRKNG